MKKNLSSFTLVELLIVCSLIGIMSGVGVKLWIQMEKNAKVSSRNLAFTAQQQMILERLTRDVRRSLQASQSGDDLLSLTQVSPHGETREVSYRLEKNELVRDERSPNRPLQSLKIASLIDAQLGVRLLENGVVRLELLRNSKDRPLEVRTNRVISFIQTLGKKP